MVGHLHYMCGQYGGLPQKNNFINSKHSVKGLLRETMATITATAVKECGDLYCQHHCYSRSLATSVVSCRPTSGKDREYGPYEVVLTDTVLFPEGGGQVS